MILWLQASSVAAGLIAAGLWIHSAYGTAPPAISDGGDQVQQFLDRIGSLNMWAAAFTAASVLLSVAATVATAAGRAGLGY